MFALLNHWSWLTLSVTAALEPWEVGGKEMGRNGNGLGTSLLTSGDEEMRRNWGLKETLTLMVGLAWFALIEVKHKTSAAEPDLLCICQIWWLSCTQHFWCGPPPPKQCFLSCEWNTANHTATLRSFRIGWMQLVDVFTLLHMTRIMRELSVRIMNCYFYGKHWAWIESCCYFGFGYSVPTEKGLGAVTKQQMWD